MKLRCYSHSFSQKFQFREKRRGKRLYLVNDFLPKSYKMLLFHALSLRLLNIKERKKKRKGVWYIYKIKLFKIWKIFWERQVTGKNHQDFRSTHFHHLNSLIKAMYDLTDSYLTDSFWFILRTLTLIELSSLNFE